VPPQEFGVPEGVGVWVGVAVGVEVGVPVGVSVGVAVGVAVGVEVDRLKVKAVQELAVGQGVAAAGLLVGAIGVIDSCLNW